MKSRNTLLLALALAACAPALPALSAAENAPRVELVAVAKADPQWLATARAAYPLDTCVVSGDKFGGDMGPPVEFVVKQDGKPDRLVRFCCKGCLKTFKKNPGKFLEKLDAAKK